MRISQKNEWILLGVLILALATSAGGPTLRGLLNTTLGKIVGLVTIVYVWKKVSAVVALLLIIMYVRYAGVFEGMENKYKKEKFENQCTCDTGFKWNSSAKICESEDPKNYSTKKPSSCTCEEGKMWDGSKAECVDKVKTDSMPSATTTQAPATSTGPVTNTNTATTPGEAMKMATENANKQLLSTEGFVPNMKNEKNYASF